jgi:DNA-directed RNA polymerase specialized sigma24 family protein
MDAELLLRHQRFLHRLVRGLVSDEDAAEDVLQATWLRALERPAREGSAPRAWLARIARNLSFNRSRAERNPLACATAAGRPADGSRGRCGSGDRAVQGGSPDRASAAPQGVRSCSDPGRTVRLAARLRALARRHARRARDRARLAR